MCSKTETETEHRFKKWLQYFGLFLLLSSQWISPPKFSLPFVSIVQDLFVWGEFPVNICARNTVAIYYADLCRTGHNNPRFAIISVVRPCRAGKQCWRASGSVAKRAADVPRIISISCTGRGGGWGLQRLRRYLFPVSRVPNRTVHYERGGSASRAPSLSRSLPPHVPHSPSIISCDISWMAGRRDGPLWK